MAKQDQTLLRLCACLYLSAKVNEFELVKIRDIINVVQFTMLNPPPSQMEDETNKALPAKDKNEQKQSEDQEDLKGNAQESDDRE